MGRRDGEDVGERGWRGSWGAVKRGRGRRRGAGREELLRGRRREPLSAGWRRDGRAGNK